MTVRIAFCAALALAGVATAGSPASAQTAPIPAAPDPARLVAATTMLDTMMPPATRAKMMDDMVGGMMNNLVQGIVKDPNFEKMFAELPGADRVFKDFVARQQDASLADLRENLPGMFDAMARAYARRFTVEQLNELTAFFRTPTGQIYIANAGSILSDPDVAKWQQESMSRSMARMPAEIAAFKQELDALAKKETPQ